METTSERNRLRTVGRVPQETRDYLSAKDKHDKRLRVWEIPLLAISAAFLFFLVVIAVRNHGRDFLAASIPAGLIGATLFYRIRRLII